MSAFFPFRFRSQALEVKKSYECKLFRSLLELYEGVFLILRLYSTFVGLISSPCSESSSVLTGTHDVWITEKVPKLSGRVVAGL